MAISARNLEADTRQGLLRVLLAVAAVWLVFWALIGGMLFAVAGPELTLSGEVRLWCLAVFGPPAALLALGLIGAEALSRSAIPAGKPEGRPARNIGVELD